MVNTEFPSVSSSSLIPRCTRTILDKAKRFGEKAPQIENGNQPDDRYNKMYHLFIRTDNKLQELVREPFFRARGVVEENKVLANAIKKHHHANCAELTRLANIICAVNEINAQPIAMIACDNNEHIISSIDHVALAIPLKENALKTDKMSKLKNVIIIDPWLGIADFAQNAILQYKNLFSKYLKLEESHHICIDTTANMHSIPKEEFQNLRREFPELILNA